MLPTCRENFGHASWNHLRPHCTCAHENYAPRFVSIYLNKFEHSIITVLVWFTRGVCSIVAIKTDGRLRPQQLPTTAFRWPLQIHFEDLRFDIFADTTQNDSRSCNHDYKFFSEWQTTSLKVLSVISHRVWLCELVFVTELRRMTYEVRLETFRFHVHDLMFQRYETNEAVKRE